jgi:thiamine-phosphate pyrophosphorylase
MDKRFLRILDANYNRAKEAIRVAEDIVRFVIEDPKLTARWKRARHDLTQVLLRFPVSYRHLVASRDSVQDVGRRSLIHDKTTKADWTGLFIANAKRSQEAMRVLEEISKIVASRQTPLFQRLRFRLYELEKASLRKL